MSSSPKINKLLSVPEKLKRYFFKVLDSTLLYLPPSDSTVSEDAEIEPGEVNLQFSKRSNYRRKRKNILKMTADSYNYVNPPKPDVKKPTSQKG